MGIERRPTEGGITKLSELDIDAAPTKAKDIADLILTTRGDILYRNTLAERLAAEYGVGMNFLHMTNSGNYVPVWKDLQTDIVYITGAVNRVIYPPILPIPVPVISLVAAEDHSGGANPIAPPALAIPMPTVAVATGIASPSAVEGAVAHDDDGVDTDQTAAANEDTADDMTLLQADGSPADWYALGDGAEFDGIVLEISTVGADITLDTFEYSKGGGAWDSLAPYMNQLANYTGLGKKWFMFTRPGDWAVDTYAAIADKYWIKLKSSATGGGYVQPLGKRAWILTYA